MTVKELVEKLSRLSDNLIVMIPNRGWSPYNNRLDVPASSVVIGTNEADGCVFIDEYEEFEDDEI